MTFHERIIKSYVRLITDGMITIEGVPEVCRAEVQAALDAAAEAVTLTAEYQQGYDQAVLDIMEEEA